jgi:hypothetical protein
MKAIIIMIVVAGLCYGEFVTFGTQQKTSAKPFCGS